MSRTRLVTEEQIEQFWDVLAEDILEASDEDILEDVCAEGKNPQEIALQGRAIIEKAIRESGQRLREGVRQSYEKARDQLRETPVRLPRLYKDKLALVQACLAKHQFLRPALMTAQHRKFDKLTSEDLDDLLRQFHFLGLLALSTRA